MIVETERLSLRELVKSDFESLCLMLKDREIMYAYEHAFDDAEAHQWLDRQIESYVANGFGLWAVILKQTGELVGQCGLTKQNCDGKEVVEIGYIFRKEFWHQGFAVEAATACKKYAFENLKIDEVFSLIRENNFPSQIVAQRNGMKAVGSFVKHYFGFDMKHIIYSVSPKSKSNQKMRRREREMDRSFAQSIVDKCEWATLAVVDQDDCPYALPVSIVRDSDVLYFHCAKEGKKVDCLHRKNRVCVTCVGETKLAIDEFSTEYESAIVRGTAIEVFDEQEKLKALKLLCLRHVPSNMTNFESEMARSATRTAVWKIVISDISGKRKKYDKQHNEMKFGRMQ